MYGSVLLSRMLALQARYLCISRHHDKSESAESAELFNKLQYQVEKGLMVAGSCLQAMDALFDGKNRICSEKMFDLSDSDNQLNHTGIKINQLTNESATESNGDLNSIKESLQSRKENEEFELDKPPVPVSLAKSKYLYYQLLVKKSKVKTPPFEAVEEYFQKMDGVEKVYSLPSENSGCIVFKSREYAQVALTSRNHSVNGCEIRLMATSQLPKPLRETDSQVQASKSVTLIPSPVNVQPALLGAPTSPILPRAGNWISFEVMVMGFEVHPLWLQTVKQYFNQFGKVVDIVKNRQGISGHVAFSSEDEALWVVSFPTHSIHGFPMRVALRKD
ncbi:hypothetical protein Aperf_G00000028082 [Anoplocephala perfoliata]